MTKTVENQPDKSKITRKVKINSLDTVMIRLTQKKIPNCRTSVYGTVRKVE